MGLPYSGTLDTPLICLICDFYFTPWRIYYKSSLFLRSVVLSNYIEFIQNKKLKYNMYLKGIKLSDLFSIFFFFWRYKRSVAGLKSLSTKGNTSGPKAIVAFAVATSLLYKTRRLECPTWSTISTCDTPVFRYLNIELFLEHKQTYPFTNFSAK